METDSVAEWEVTNYFRQMPAGRTRPPLCECTSIASPDAQRTMLLKSVRGELHEQNLFAEYVGCRFATAWGILAPVSHLVHISPQVADLLPIEPPMSPGLAVGVEYMEGPLQAASPLGVPADLLDAAASLFVFDLLFQNYDRKAGNPNCAYSASKLFAYDFELCFSFVTDLFGDDAPWQLGKHRAEAATHVFYPELKRRHAKMEYAGIESKVEDFAANKMGAILSDLPGKWEAKSRQVKEHTMKLAEHASLLEMGICEVLA